MRPLRFLAGLLVLGLLLPGVARAVTAGPVAVLPFKNLNADPESEWLTTGVAETMITDLKKSGLIKVVERKQLDAALTEMALQGLSRTDPSTAARVGKMVGAKAVVVGSFQRAGGKLRFVARMVDVETGLIAETAKVTGPAYSVFDLQDQITLKLLGVPPPARRRRARPKAQLAAKERKKAEKRVKAYRLYAMSLTVASDADRVGWLKKSVEIDPEFSYALDDLAELEARMVEYRKQHEVQVAVQNDKLRKELEEEKDPIQRMQKATMLMSSHLSSFHYSALLVDAQTVYDMEWEKPENLSMWVNPKELAAYYIVLGHQMLKHTDLALQLGERFLGEFPKSMYFSGVDATMRSMIDRQKEIARGAESYPAELAELEAKREEKVEQAKERGREMPPSFFANLDFSRCSKAFSLKQYAAALKECGGIVAEYGAKDDPQFDEQIFNAGYFRILSLAELGRFQDAREAIEELGRRYPDRTDERRIDAFERSWPR